MVTKDEDTHNTQEQALVSQLMMVFTIFLLAMRCSWISEHWRISFFHVHKLLGNVAVVTAVQAKKRSKRA